MNYKRKRPRFKSRSQAPFPNGSPSHWNILFHSRPRRRRDDGMLRLVQKGGDSDELAWSLGNSKPHHYYW